MNKLYKIRQTLYLTLLWEKAILDFYYEKFYTKM